MRPADEGPKQAAGPRGRGPYDRLPDPIRLEDTIASTDPGPPPDPDGGGNPERDFMLRYAG